MRDALPFLHRATRVTVVEACGPGEKSALDRLDDVGRYLMNHRIKAGPKVTLEQKGSGAEQLLRIAREERADLLITGAYGHSRLGEWIFGGMTRERSRPVRFAASCLTDFSTSMSAGGGHANAGSIDLQRRQATRTFALRSRDAGQNRLPRLVWTSGLIEFANSLPGTIPDVGRQLAAANSARTCSGFDSDRTQQKGRQMPAVVGIGGLGRRLGRAAWPHVVQTGNSRRNAIASGDVPRPCRPATARSPCSPLFRCWSFREPPLRRSPCRWSTVADRRCRTHRPPTVQARRPASPPIQECL